MVEEETGLVAGFTIDLDDAFGGLKSLDDIFGTTVADMIREWKKVENVVGADKVFERATAEVRAFGTSADRELRAVARATNAAEKSAEALTRKIRSQTETFNMSASEIRNMNAELRATEAEARGLTKVAADLRAANAEMNRLEAGVGGIGRASARSRGTMMQFGMQMNDVATMAALGAPPMQIFASQIGQITQVAQGAEGGVRGFIGQLGGIALAYAPLIAASAVAVGGFALFSRAVSEGINTQKMVDGLGLTRDEIKKLKDVSVDTGDVMGATFQVLAQRVGLNMGKVKAYFGSALDYMTSAGRMALSALYAQFAGTFGAIGTIVRGFIAGKGLVDIAKDVGGAYVDAYNRADGALKRFGSDVNKQIASNKLAELTKQADALKLDRAEKKPKAPEKPKVDRHAEQLARENAAIEAQIRNLYALADAYGVSGAAALIAEARVKAESDAIKKRGDIEMFVDRQVRLAIAQRVSDAEKSAATMRDQARIQTEVNAQVAAGLVPAALANDLVRDRVAELVLLAAVEAAQQRGLKTEVDKATKALQDQRDALADAKAAGTGAFFVAADKDADRKLEALREEARLIGLTGLERVKALATIRATQEIVAKGEALGTTYADAYIAKQRQIAVETELNTARQNDYTASLTATADQWDQIAQSVRTAADGMADSFGRFGQAIGDVASIYSGFRADQERARTVHEANMAKELTAAGKQREMAKFTAVTSGAQIRLYGDMAAASKSFFGEHSKGAKAAMAAERVFRAYEFAMSVRSMVQDVAETISSVANSGARAAAAGAEGVANQSKLVFPLNIAAMAATGAALVAAGIAMFAGGGGGGTATPPMSADDRQAGAGTGTLLGDMKGQSESIARSIELMAKNSSADLEFANPTLKALHSIDNSISRMAGTIARQVQVSGSMFDTSGQGLGTNSKSGFLGVFGGSTTTKSLYDLGMTLAAGTVGDILANGIAGQTYQVIEKVKKSKGFLGIGGGTKTSYSTTYGAIDTEITSAIQGVVGSLRNGLLSAADLIGVQGAQAILDGFQVALGTVSFKDMTGTEIESQLNAVFSSIGDQMAGRLLPSLSAMQEVGEGLFETFIRVAKEYQSVDVALRSIGRSFGQVGLESVAARDALVQLFGGLDGFMESTDAFRQQFLTEAEQIAPVMAAVRVEMARLGLSGITTRDQFKQTVLGLNLTTDAGRETYAALLKVAPAFDKVLDAQEQAGKDMASTLKDTVETFQQLTEGLRKYRDTLFATDAAQGATYGALRSKFTSTADLAAQGDQAALGNLEGTAKAFLDASLNQASTREQYQRDVALVAQGVDKGIFAAEATADYAQLQLDALGNAVTLLGVIATNTATTTAALEATHGVVGAIGAAGRAAPTTGRSLADAASVSAGATARSTDRETVEELRSGFEGLRREMSAMRAESKAGHAETAYAAKKTSRILEDVTAESGGLAFAMADTTSVTASSGNGGGTTTPPTTVPTLDNTYANSETVRANNIAFAGVLLDLEQQIAALGG